MTVWGLGKDTHPRVWPGGVRMYLKNRLGLTARPKCQAGESGHYSMSSKEPLKINHQGRNASGLCDGGDWGQETPKH